MSLEVFNRLPLLGMIAVTSLTTSIDASRSIPDFSDNITRPNASLINATAPPPATTRFMPTIANTTRKVVLTTTETTASPWRRPDDGSGRGYDPTFAIFLGCVIGIPIGIVLLCGLCCAVRRCSKKDEIIAVVSHTTRRVSPVAAGGSATTTVATATPVIVTVGSIDADGSNIESTSRNEPTQFEMVASAALSAPTAAIAHEEAGVVADGFLVHDTSFPYGRGTYEEPSRNLIVEERAFSLTPDSTSSPPMVRSCW